MWLAVKMPYRSHNRPCFTRVMSLHLDKHEIFGAFEAKTVRVLVLPARTAKTMRLITSAGPNIHTQKVCLFAASIISQAICVINTYTSKFNFIYLYSSFNSNNGCYLKAALQRHRNKFQIKLQFISNVYLMR